MEGSSKLYSIVWNYIYKPKDRVGLGLKSLEEMNVISLA